jgi:hypothetical protein
MDFKHYINYFKKNENMKLIGGGILIVGFISIWLRLGFLWLLSVMLIPAGFVMFIVGSGGRASEADIDKYISDNMDKLEVDLSEDRHYRKRILEHIPAREVEGYLYDEGVMLKKAKNSSIRSSKYTKAIFYTLSDELYITRRTISIVSTEKENETVEIPYDTLTNVEIVRQRGTKKDGKKAFLVKETFIKISYGEGESFVTPIHDDITADEFANQILKQAKAYKDEKETQTSAE